MHGLIFVCLNYLQFLINFDNKIEFILPDKCASGSESLIEILWLLE